MINCLQKLLCVHSIMPEAEMLHFPALAAKHFGECFMVQLMISFGIIADIVLVPQHVHQHSLIFRWWCQHRSAVHGSCCRCRPAERQAMLEHMHGMSSCFLYMQGMLHVNSFKSSQHVQACWLVVCHRWSDRVSSSCGLNGLTVTIGGCLFTSLACMLAPALLPCCCIHV